MEAIKGTYKNGKIELKHQPIYSDPIEVLIIFPEKKKQIKKIRGLFKGVSIDYDQIAVELKKLRQESLAHLMSEWENGNE
jgi:hypothetical protein